MTDTWSVAGRTFTSRLIVGTGKYKDFEQNAAAVAASGAEIVTVAVRRVNVSDPNAPMDIESNASTCMLGDNMNCTLSGNVVITQGTLKINAARGDIT